VELEEVAVPLNVGEIVVGDRGVGKSFWSSVLKDDAARTAIAPIYPRLGLRELSVFF